MSWLLTLLPVFFRHLRPRFESFDLISVGFPGYVRNGVVCTAPNLGTDQWCGVNFQQILSDHFRKPVLVVNDADLLGLGIASGEGLELVVTLGTGFGTALLLSGKLSPHFEIALHPVFQELDYVRRRSTQATDREGLERTDAVCCRRAPARLQLRHSLPGRRKRPPADPPLAR